MARVDVVQSQAALGELVAVLVGDRDVPQLLGAALMYRRGAHCGGGRLGGAQKVGAVVHPDGDLSALGDSRARTDAGGAFYRRSRGGRSPP